MGSGTGRYFWREVSQSFKRNLMLNFSSIATVMVLIFQLGFFMLMVENINNFTGIVLSKLRITVIMSPGLSLEKYGKIKHRINKIPEVEVARYISKEMAFKRLKEKLKGKVDLTDLAKNPLPDTIEIEMKKPSKIREVAEEVKKYPGVESIRYGDAELIDRLFKLSRGIYIVGIITISMLLISAVFLISNTIRLTVFSRRKEIAIMELVGASHWFIRGPFIVEGLVHGLVGSGIAILLLDRFYANMSGWILENFKFVPILTPEAIMFKVTLVLLGVGILVGVGSSYVSVNKYLKV